MCACSIRLSVSDVISATLEPTIASITTLITATLVNTDYFGAYTINHVFMLLGGFIGCNSGSSISTITTSKFQEALKVCNHKKKIEPNCFYSMKTVESIIRPEKGKTCFAFDSFTRGMLQQVSSETCVMGLERYGDIKIDILSQTDGSDRLMSSKAAGNNCSVTILQKGQPIPNDGILRVFYIANRDNYRKGSLYTSKEEIAQLVRIKKVVCTITDIGIYFYT